MMGGFRSTAIGQVGATEEKPYARARKSGFSHENSRNRTDPATELC